MSEQFKLVDAVFDPDAEVIEKLLRTYKVTLFPSPLGSFTAMASYPNEKKRQVPEERFTDDFTPARALARLAYKVVFRQVVRWADENAEVS